MASMTETRRTPLLVSRYTARLDEQAAAEDAARLQRRREAQERAMEILETGELATRLSSMDFDDNAHVGIEGQATGGFSGQRDHHNYSNRYELPVESDITSLSDTSSIRIRDLEAHITNQNARIQQLETDHHGLIHKIEDLRARRDQEEVALTNAIISGEDRNPHEDIILGLRQQIDRLIEEKQGKEREIDNQNKTIRELQNTLAEERERARSQEVRTNAGEPMDMATSSSVLATMDDSSRSGQLTESDRRRHKHGKSKSKGNNPAWTASLEFSIGRNNKKSTKHGHK